MDSVKMLLAALFVLVIFLGNFVYLFNNHGFHESQFEQLGVNQTLALNVVAFVAGKSALSEGFNERESSHLADVAKLFFRIKIVYYSVLAAAAAVLICLLFTRRFNPAVPASVTMAGAISLLLLLILFLLSINFQIFFSAIHKPFFAADTWLFPSDSLLIKAFPQQYFQNFMFKLLRLIFINSALFFGIGLFVGKKFKQQPLVKGNDAEKL
ncbi:DUF1461 domain-containing protein [Candidatus Woesearchaeota archaeon]|nr:DUF1461 domain-containing protein [Candidatus Woesearchaeota archaeon]